MEKTPTIDDVFTPSTPVELESVFAGRKEELERILDTFQQKGCHLIMYGERGVGKTSIANIIKNTLHKQDKFCFKINCGPNDNFSILWFNIFDQIAVANYNKGYHITEKWFEEDCTRHKVKSIIKSLENKCLYIFDEFDQIKDEDTKLDFTYLIKNLSDEGLNATILLVGIAENVEELIGNHQSLERCLKEINVKLMSEKELEEIIDKGLQTLNIEIEDKIKDRIIKLSEGYPRYTHLLSRYCCRHLIENKLNIIGEESLKYATKQSLMDAEENIKRDYQKAIINDSRDNYIEILSTCALSKKNEFGAFTHTDIIETLKKISKKNIKADYRDKLNKLCEEERGTILKRRGKTRYTYEFRNPLMQVYIRLKYEAEKK